MNFESFTVGQKIEIGPLPITEERVLSFAKDWDPQWFHIDKERAEKGRWKGLIASGWHTTAVAMRAFCEQVLEGTPTFGSPGVDEIRWPNPVRPGDQLTLHVTVIECRVSATRPELGVFRTRWEMLNQNEKTVLSLFGTTLFDLS